MKNILICTSLLSPYRVDWLNELSKYYKIKILVLEELDKERENSWLSKKPEHCDYQLMKGIRFFKTGKISHDFIKEIKRNLYDIFILDGYGFVTQLINMRYLNKRHIPYFVNVDGIVQKEKTNWLIDKFKRKVISNVPYFLCGSKASNDILIKYGARKENIFNHPFTSLFEKDLFKEPASDEEKQKLKDELKIKENKIVLSVGRFSYLNGYGKGYDVLIRSAGMMSKDIGWYILGGEPTEEFKKMIEDNHLTNVHFLGFKDKETLKKYYRLSDVFVLMSVSDVWGLVINEAMSCGLPVITTNKCMAGLDLIKDNKTGYVVNVGDDKNLAQKINHILDNNLSFPMGVESLKIIKSYTIENLALTHKKIFESFLNNL